MDSARPITEIIPMRFSCRTYIQKPLEEDLQARIRKFCARQTSGPLGGQARFVLAAGSDDNLKELKGLGTYGFIRGATGFLVGATSAQNPPLEDFGYLLEEIVLYITGLGLGSCWLGGTFTKTSFGAKIDVQADELVPSVASIGYISKKPRWLDGVIRGSAGANHRRPWEKLFYDGQIGNPLTEYQAGDYATPLKMVRIAPSASNKQPWRILREGGCWHFLLRRTPGYRERRLVRLTTVADLQRVDMGIAMCHFELSARELGLAGGWRYDDPGIADSDMGLEYVATWS